MPPVASFEERNRPNGATNNGNRERSSEAERSTIGSAGTVRWVPRVTTARVEYQSPRPAEGSWSYAVLLLGCAERRAFVVEALTDATVSHFKILLVLLCRCRCRRRCSLFIHKYVRLQRLRRAVQGGHRPLPLLRHRPRRLDLAALGAEAVRAARLPLGAGAFLGRPGLVAHLDARSALVDRQLCGQCARQPELALAQRFALLRACDIFAQGSKVSKEALIQFLAMEKHTVGEEAIDQLLDELGTDGCLSKADMATLIGANKKGKKKPQGR